MKDMRRAVQPFLFLLSIISGLAGIIAMPGWFRNIALSILGLSLVVLLIFYSSSAWRLSRRKAGLPADVLREVGTYYSIDSARPEEISWIAEIEAKKYDADAVPERILRDWYNVNPKGFFIIRIHSGRKIGHLDILPIRPLTLQKFIRGDIIEKEILSDSIFKLGESAQIQNLYVESIIVDPPRECSRSDAVRTLLFHIDTLVQALCPPSQIDKVYALAATNDGTNFMKRPGFAVIVPGHERRDGLDLLCVSFREFRAVIGRIIKKQSGGLIESSASPDVNLEQA
jgi:hypothetical protein